MKKYGNIILYVATKNKKIWYSSIVVNKTEILLPDITKKWLISFDKCQTETEIKLN